MNQSTPPPLNTPQYPAKTSNLAIWSLSLGILSMACCFVVTGVPGVICGHRALSNIKNSGGAIEGRGLAIAGLVTGYVGIALSIFLIPLMAAIAIPNFINARNTAQRNACINNLRMIDGAKQQWALENSQQATAVPTPADLNKYLPHGFESLHCPAGGSYEIHSVQEEPTCTILKHQLPGVSSSPGRL